MSKFLMPKLIIPQFNNNALHTLETRYLCKSDDGEIIETPIDRLYSVAEHVASVEKTKVLQQQYTIAFYHMMANLEVLPNSPTLRNAGANRGCLSACFVLPIADDLRKINQCLDNCSVVQKMGGGTGVNFSSLRPSGDLIKSTSGVTQGPIGFMKVFDIYIGEVINQGGTRQGAQMGILNVDHPDIFRFINIKRKEGILKNFNLSVGITAAFMKVLAEGGEWPLIFNNKIYQVVKAQEIWDNIIEGAWINGEPGIAWLDTIRQNTPYGTNIEATNPCGEQPLLPYESCNLASLNLATCIDFDKRIIDRKKIASLVPTIVRFLDNIIEVNNYPIPEIKKTTHYTRRIGLGIMGWADALAYLGIRYGSDESAELARSTMAFIEQQAILASESLGKERGFAPVFAKETVMYKGVRIKPRRNVGVTTIAPTGTLSLLAGCSSGIEPWFSWGYTSHRVNTLFMEFPAPLRRWLMTNDHTDLVHNIDTKLSRIKVSDFYDGNDPALREDAIFKAKAEANKVLDTDFRSKLIDILPSHFAISETVSVDGHINTMAAFQEHVMHGVSKTINMPNSVTREDISSAFIKAYNMNVKGMTVYRLGSRKHEMITTSSNGNVPSVVGEFGNWLKNLDSEIAKGDYDKKADGYVVSKLMSLARKSGFTNIYDAALSEIESFANKKPYREKPKMAPALRYSFRLGEMSGDLLLSFYENGDLCEVYVLATKNGSTINGLLALWGIATSIGLRYGVPLTAFIEKFAGHKFDPAGFTGDPNLPMADSIGDFLSRWLNTYIIEKKTKSILDTYTDSESGGTVTFEETVKNAEVLYQTVVTEFDYSDGKSCPSCGFLMAKKGTCYFCTHCGNSLGSCS